MFFRVCCGHVSGEVGLGGHDVMNLRSLPESRLQDFMAVEMIATGGMFCTLLFEGNFEQVLVIYERQR